MADKCTREYGANPVCVSVCFCLLLFLFKTVFYLNILFYHDHMPVTVKTICIKKKIPGN